jgi:hypothetical protein
MFREHCATPRAVSERVSTMSSAKHFVPAIYALPTVLSKNDARMTRSDNPDLLPPAEEVATEIVGEAGDGHGKAQADGGRVESRPVVCALGHGGVCNQWRWYSIASVARLPLTILASSLKAGCPDYRRSTTMPRRFACGMKQTSGMFGGSQD